MNILEKLQAEVRGLRSTVTTLGQAAVVIDDHAALKEDGGIFEHDIMDPKLPIEFFYRMPDIIEPDQALRRRVLSHHPGMYLTSTRCYFTPKSPIEWGVESFVADQTVYIDSVPVLAGVQWGEGMVRFLVDLSFRLWQTGVDGAPKRSYFLDWPGFAHFNMEHELGFTVVQFGWGIVDHAVHGTDEQLGALPVCGLMPELVGIWPPGNGVPAWPSVPPIEPPDPGRPLWEPLV